MKTVLATAILDEIQLELNKQSPSSQDAKTRRTHAGSLELAYCEAAYLLSIKLPDDGRLTYRFCRMPNCELVKNEYRLTDSTLFTKIANAMRAATHKDRILVRVLERAAWKLLDSFRRAMPQPAGWDITYYGPGLNCETVSVWAVLRPLEIKLTFPRVQYRLILTANKNGDFEVAIYSDNVELPMGPDNVSHFLRLMAPSELSSKRWNAAELPHVTSAAVRHIENFVRNRLLPVESAAVSREARQAMLVLVPVRLAETARKQGDVTRCREVVDAGLLQLTDQPASPKIVLKQLFLQLLHLELTELTDLENWYSSRMEYERLGLVLAELPPVDDSLSYNPVHAYDCHLDGRIDLTDKLSDQDRETYRWFLEQASLEQVVDLMTLL